MCSTHYYVFNYLWFFWLSTLYPLGWSALDRSCLKQSLINRRTKRIKISLKQNYPNPNVKHSDCCLHVVKCKPSRWNGFWFQPSSTVGFGNSTSWLFLLFQPEIFHQLQINRKQNTTHILIKYIHLQHMIKAKDCLILGYLVGKDLASSWVFWLGLIPLLPGFGASAASFCIRALTLTQVNELQ